LHEIQSFSSLETLRAMVFEVASAASKNGWAVLGAGRRLFQI
jgi:superoxide dismutase